MLEYIQIFADMESLFEPYDDAQRGRLIMAMMAYTYRGEEPNFTGVEKFIWPVLRQHIDRCAQNVEAKKAAGSKGGKGSKSSKQTEADESNVKQNEAEASKAKQTEADESESKRNAHNHDHDNDHDKDNDKDNDDVVCARARAEAPAATTTDPVIGIDGQDLSESIRLNAEVDALLRTYRLSEAVRGDLLEDIEKHGLDKVKRVMQEAAKSDTKGGLSIRFIRACLENDGKPKPQRAAPGSAKAFDQMMRYTPEERKKTYSSAILDFDEVD